jgi:hypothetical protein
MKRRSFLGVAAPVLTGAVAAALLPPDPAEAAGATGPFGISEKAILALERQWMNALVQRDEATLNSLTADDFTRVEKPWPNFAMPRGQWLGNAIHAYRIESFRLQGSSVRFTEQTAVVATRYRWRGVLGDVPLNETVSVEDTWGRRESRWQIVSQFVARTEKLGPAAERITKRKAIEVDSALYLAYEGKYRFGPGRVLTIRSEDSRLFHEGSGGRRVELLPETTTRFFRTDSGVLTVFVKKDGLVTHVVHRHTNGRESIGKRIA